MVEKICGEILDEVVVPANYNCPGQLVISGSLKAVERACERLSSAGAKRALILPVGGAFHSPLMEPARDELERAIREVEFKQPVCPVYQNVATKAIMDPSLIRTNLIAQLTSSVKWTQSVQNMILDGATEFIELGPGRALQGMILKIDRSVSIAGLSR
jgi:[acyl-carrier-protein] S-malonyltransferase